MKKLNKPRKIDLPIIDELLNETSELERVQLEDRLELAMKIEKLLQIQGFKTHKDFAKHIGRSVSEVSRWLSGYHNLTQNTQSEIAHGLGLKLCDLFNTEVKVEFYETKQIVSSSASYSFPKSWNKDMPTFEIQVKSTKVNC